MGWRCGARNHGDGFVAQATRICDRGKGVGGAGSHCGGLRVLTTTRRRRLSLSAAALALVACVDIFHSTDDFRSRCEETPAACQPDAMVPIFRPSSPCALSPSEAKLQAERTCAWLGACESPIGSQQFSACVTRALRVFNCSIEPGQLAKGKTLDIWSCLTTVTDCDDVRRCLIGDRTEVCLESSTYLNCSRTSPGVRIGCRDKLIAFEDCAAWGQTCVAHEGRNDAECGGSTSESACTEGCIGGIALRACVSNGASTRDEGFDCSLRGDGRCENGGCTGPGVACSEGASVTCTYDEASLCFAGHQQTIQCGALGMKCQEGALARAWDPASACVGQSACTGDRCSGATLTSCSSAVERSVNCAAVSLGNCEIVTTVEGPRAACQKP